MYSFGGDIPITETGFGIPTGFGQTGINPMGGPGPFGHPVNGINNPVGFGPQQFGTPQFGPHIHGLQSLGGMTNPLNGIQQRGLGIGFQPNIGLHAGIGQPQFGGQSTFGPQFGVQSNLGPQFGAQSTFGTMLDSSQRQLAQATANACAQGVQQACQQAAPQAAQCAAECVQAQSQVYGISQLAPTVAQIAAQCAQQAVQTTAPILAQRAAQLCLIQASQIGGNNPQALVQIAAQCAQQTLQQLAPFVAQNAAQWAQQQCLQSGLIQVAPIAQECAARCTDTTLRQCSVQAAQFVAQICQQTLQQIGTRTMTSTLFGVGGDPFTQSRPLNQQQQVQTPIGTF